jgi:hypothetical protein
MRWTQPLARFVALPRVPRVVVIASDTIASCEVMAAACAIAFVGDSTARRDRTGDHVAPVDLVAPVVHRVVNASPNDALIARVDLMLISGELPRELATRGIGRWLARRARVVRVVEASSDGTVDLSWVARPPAGLPVKRIQMIHAAAMAGACAMFVESRAGRAGGLVVEAAVTIDEPG